MATYKARGNAHNVIYPYLTELGVKKQQWETYTTELEAIQRKAYIDYLQKNRLHHEIRKEADEYRRKRAVERAVSEQFGISAPHVDPPGNSTEDNSQKTYREFVEKWLPYHARKKRFSPNSYDSYRSNLDNHILPFFGHRIMSSITAEDIDSFLDHLSRKPCKGAKSYGKRPDEVATLSSSSIKKCYTVLFSGFPTAKKWHYIREIPDVAAPSEKTVNGRRGMLQKPMRSWNPSRMMVFCIWRCISRLFVHCALAKSSASTCRRSTSAKVAYGLLVRYSEYQTELWRSYQKTKSSAFSRNKLPDRKAASFSKLQRRKEVIESNI